MKNSADLGGCYPPRPSASVDNTLIDLQNSSFPTQPHSIIAKYFRLQKNSASWEYSRKSGAGAVSSLCAGPFRPLRRRHSEIQWVDEQWRNSKVVSTYFIATLSFNPFCSGPLTDAPSWVRSRTSQFPIILITVATYISCWRLIILSPGKKNWRSRVCKFSIYQSHHGYHPCVSNNEKKN